MTTTSAPDIEELPCDLLEFIADRSGVGVDAVATLLGDFLIQYEPRRSAAARFASGLAA